MPINNKCLYCAGTDLHALVNSDVQYTKHYVYLYHSIVYSQYNAVYIQIIKLHVKPSLKVNIFMHL